MNRWLQRLLKLRYPKSMKHMAEIHPFFRIDTDSGGQQIAHWRGKPAAALQPLRPLRDSRRGESSFIVAAGPSIAALDLSAIAGQTLFGVNGSIAKFAGSDVRPSFYVITDANFVLNRFELVEAAFACRPHLFLTAKVMSAICEKNPALLGSAPVSLIETHFCPYNKPRYSREAITRLVEETPTLHASSWRIGFSRDIELGLFSAHTVVYYAIQIAAWMGYSPIFMLGTDFGSDGDQVRFYEQREQAQPSGMDRDFDKFIRPSFEVLQQVSRQMPALRVYNLSPSSRLSAEIIPKLSLNEALDLIDAKSA